jgi:hypothetical protein
MECLGGVEICNPFESPLEEHHGWNLCIVPGSQEAWNATGFSNRCQSSCQPIFRCRAHNISTVLAGFHSHSIQRGAFSNETLEIHVSSILQKCNKSTSLSSVHASVEITIPPQKCNKQGKGRARRPRHAMQKTEYYLQDRNQ